jgi:hypothetical protein
MAIPLSFRWVYRVKKDRQLDWEHKKISMGIFFLVTVSLKILQREVKVSLGKRKE